MDKSAFKLWKVRYFWTAIILSIFIIFGCSSYVSISDIKADPTKYQNQQVAVKGRVTETFAIPFINKGMYQISDDSESIWILTKRDVPFRGDKVIVRGEVKTAVTVNNRTFGTIIAEN
jgi:hypothetical protein